MASIAEAIARIKRDPIDMLDRGVVEKVCDELNYNWRDGKLNPAITLGGFIQQVVYGKGRVRGTLQGQTSITKIAAATERRP